MNRFFPLTFLSLIALVGSSCATAGSRSWTDAEFKQLVVDYNNKVEAMEQVSCEKIARAGSHLRKWQCRKKWADKVERVETKELLTRLERKGGLAGKH